MDVEYRPRRLLVKLYLRSWRLLGNLMGMVQGATQFCRRDAFEEVGGYDEGAWIGEDVDFYWDLRKLARKTNREVRLIRNPRVRPSCRRFDKWPLWKILVWTKPPLHRGVPALEGGLGRLVLRCRPVGSKRPE